MKSLASALLLLILASGCAAMSSGTEPNKGDLKKSPCSMVTPGEPAGPRSVTMGGYHG